MIFFSKLTFSFLTRKESLGSTDACLTLKTNLGTISQESSSESLQGCLWLGFFLTAKYRWFQNVNQETLLYLYVIVWFAFPFDVHTSEGSLDQNPCQHRLKLKRFLAEGRRLKLKIWNKFILQVPNPAAHADLLKSRGLKVRTHIYLQDIRV